ncbi:DUF1876 domain-containing protein [Haloechinothrix sp. LS1_15]|uniref:DUF1876 domain-containing protein n=1 Tax=Haloechinothrix sp. LS1_15 TaxID=2652248 RepID=UPI002945BD53|nr:DUF1876 domain-containing protein [Haloechinothrix sp. LS1_15]MDV6013294.1 DUF1876 domain-containing protein [Haloechinothrix sp. LS1_15]
MHEKHWNVEITIDEFDDRTRAKAKLQSDRGTDMTGVGLARLNPEDRNVPEIGDELATSRALSDLAHRLLDVTAEDIERVTHQPAHLTH